MKNKLCTPVLTTPKLSGTGFYRGVNQMGGVIPFVPGREKRQKRSKVRVPCGRIWPNGEFGLSYHDKSEESDPLPVHPHVPNGWTPATLAHGLKSYVWGVWPAGQQSWPSPPWLGKSAKSAQRPKTYGRKGLTPYGAKMVRSGAFLMQERYGKNRLSFITLTVPPLVRSHLVEVAQSWGYLVKALLQGLRRLLSKVGLPSEVVLVTELQPKRLSSGDIGCLHIHLILVGRHPRSGWAYSPFVYRALWLRLISNLIGETLECYPCENVVRVEKDAGNYLSKYMSKGSSDIEAYADIEGWECVPRQWWSATKSIKALVKNTTVSGEVAMKLLDEMLYNYWAEGGEPNTMGFKFARPITLDIGGERGLLIGFFGRVTRESLADLRSLTRVLKSA